MRIFTLNVKNNPDLAPWQVREDFKRARRLMGRGVVIGGFQEIHEEADHRALRNQFNGYTEISPNQATPQVYGKRIRLIGTKYIKAHGSKPKRSPHRGYQVSRFSFWLRPRIQEFVVINTHMVSKPYKDEWAESMWFIHWAMMKDTVAEAHNNGLDVILVGDLNKINPPKLHKDEVILNQRGLDHIILVPAVGGNKYTVVDKGYARRGFHTDHPLVWVDLKVRRK